MQICMNLVLTFTYTISLKDWEKVGLLDREVIIYQRFSQKGINLYFSLNLCFPAFFLFLVVILQHYNFHAHEIKANAYTFYKKKEYSL